MRVCVVGSGHLGTAHAAMLALEGHETTLLKTTDFGLENFEAIRRARGIVLRGLDGSERFVPIRLATRDPFEALPDPIDALVVVMQTSGLERAASLVGSALRRAKIAIVAPGYLGSAYFRRALGERCPICAEGESPAYDARVEEPGVVRICFKNVRNALGFYDPATTAEGLALAGALVDAYRYSRANVVDSALRNPNLVLHTLGVVTSASRVEYSGGDFWLYREAFTPSVWRAIERLDAEKNAVIAAFGGKPTSYLEDCLFRNSPDLTADPMETFRNYARSGGPKGPSSLETRYLTEDAPNGLGLLCSLGAKLGIPTPTARATMTLAGALLGRDFEKEARTTETLGFNSLCELRRFCHIDDVA